MNPIQGTDSLSLLLMNMTAYTGSLFLTLLIITAMLILIPLAFNVPLELSAIIVFPFLMGAMLVTSQFYSVLAVAIVYLAFIMGRWLLLR